ncbi:Hypp4679 [Branchiostoma lanceolatum]|uniref:Hypp4679 protein n=1 Tax=Branchiostoma lanceolatum TaxID=7740 RepID=A0A8K0A908_BRALA|nr:Hypp4679 [Branchiostoma lanceolatum]
MFFVIAHLCLLTSWLGVSAAPTRSPREVTYTCPPGRVWDPINEDCPPCTICYEYPDMEMCQNNACPDSTTPAAGQTTPSPNQTTMGADGVKGLDGGIVAIIVLGSILASVAILLAITYLLYKIRENAQEKAENNEEEELKLPIQEGHQGTSERVVME